MNNNLTHIPDSKAFTVISTAPILKIRLNISLLMRAFLGIILLPFVILFLGHLYMLLMGVYSLLTLDISQTVFWLSYGTDQILYVLILVFTGSLLGVAFCLWVYILTGSAELVAAPGSLRMRYKLIGILFQEKTILASELRYFNRFCKNGESPAWVLEAVTDKNILKKEVKIPKWMPQRFIQEDLIVRFSYFTLEIFSHQNLSLVDWLGHALADFYDVSFRVPALPATVAVSARDKQSRDNN